MATGVSLASPLVPLRASADKLVQLYAGPSSWGPSLQVNECFGANPVTKFEEVESNVGGPIRYQARADSGQWTEAMPGVFLRGQVIDLRAKVAGGTGGYAKLRVSGTCIR